MRPITKLLLLGVLAFIVFLLWPRTADMKAFDPVKLAALEVASWQAQKADKGFDAWKARFKIYSSQYHFDPTSAFRIAQSQGAALKSLMLSRGENADATEEGRSIQSFTEKYTWIKKQAKLDINTDALAREEFAWRLLELDGNPPADIAPPISRILAALYGGNPADFLDVATHIASARALIFKGDPSTGEPDVYSAKTMLEEAYKNLHEIALTPPAATPAP
ncbi:MAG: hypothetical protein ACREKL_05870 [Chthoniobacterales bacterium]